MKNTQKKKEKKLVYARTRFRGETKITIIKNKTGVRAEKN